MVRLDVLAALLNRMLPVQAQAHESQVAIASDGVLVETVTQTEETLVWGDEMYSIENSNVAEAAEAIALTVRDSL